jgi:hypothetical protein
MGGFDSDGGGGEGLSDGVMMMDDNHDDDDDDDDDRDHDEMMMMMVLPSAALCPFSVLESSSEWAQGYYDRPCQLPMEGAGTTGKASMNKVNTVEGEWARWVEVGRERV